ncbi:MAG: sensor histidine kinase [Thermoflexales bacterium]|nr:sensor histidine kinase [Thermoflexales bacterium]
MFNLAESELPVPKRVLVPYIWFWHIVTMLAHVVTMGIVLYFADRGGGIDARVAAFVALQVLQLALYVGFYVFPKRWPPAAWQHGLYFGFVLVAWLVQAQLVPRGSGLIWMFFGHAIGLLPLRAALLVAGLITALFLLQRAGWQLAQVMRLPETALVLGFVALSLSIYLLLAYAMRTSLERGQLLAKLEAANRELERSRLRDVELAQLMERERIARDLHDYLGHALVALSMQLEMIQRLHINHPERLIEQLEQAKALVRTCMKALRRTVSGLRGEPLEERPLSEALTQLCVALSASTGVRIHCHVDSKGDRLPPRVAEALWAVTHEALSNVVKHARASEAEVTLAVDSQGAHLHVRDNGIGIGQNTAHDGYGLRTMRERLQALGGALHVQNASEAHWRGVHVYAFVPHPCPSEAGEA